MSTTATVSTPKFVEIEIQLEVKSVGQPLGRFGGLPDVKHKNRHLFADLEVWIYSMGKLDKTIRMANPFFQPSGTLTLYVSPMVAEYIME